MAFTVQSGVDTIANSSLTGSNTGPLLPHEVFYSAGVAVEEGTVNTSPNNIVFDCNQSGTTITATSGTIESGNRNLRTYKLTLDSGTISGGLTTGNYYHVNYLSATTFELLAYREDNGTNGQSASSLTAQTGTARLVEVGVSHSANRSNIFTSSQTHGRNACMVGSDFTGNEDLSNALVAVNLEASDTDGNGVWCFFVDSAGEWVMFEQDTGNFVGFRWFTYDLSNAAGHNTYVTKSSGTFNAASVARYFQYVFPNNTASAVNSLLTATIYKLGTAVLTGSGTLGEACDALVTACPVNTQPLAGVYGLVQPFEIGDGGINATTLNQGTSTFVFYARADGTTTFQFNPTKQAFTVNSGSSDILNFNGYTVRSDSLFDFDMTTATAPAASSAVGFTLLNADLTLDPDVSLNGANFFAINSITDNSDTVNDAVWDASENLPVEVVDGQTATIRNATNGMLIDTAGSYDISGVTFSNNTNDIDITASTGTVTLEIGGKATPSFTTAGATVTFTSNVSVTAPNFVDTTRVQLWNLSYDRVNFINLSGTFTTSETITGGTSGATATVDSVASTYVEVSSVSGTFQRGETITGGTSGATATFFEKGIELDNSAVSGGSGYSITLNLQSSEVAAGDELRIRATQAGTSTAKEEFQSNGTVTLSGLNFTGTQENDPHYATWGIDGSTITKFTADYVDNEVNVVVASDFELRELGAWWIYNLTTAQGIREFYGGLTIVDEANLRINNSVVDILLDNTTSTNVAQTDNRRLYRADLTRPVKNPGTGTGGIDVEWRSPVSLANTDSLTASLTTIDSIVDAIKAVTDNLPDSGALTSKASQASVDTVDSIVDSILVDTNELQTDWADGGRLDAILDARASQTSVDTVDSNVDAILVDTGTTIPAQITALNDFDPTTQQVTVATNNDKAGYSISGTLTTLDALDTAQDAQHSTTQSAIGALNNFNPATQQVTVSTNNDKTGYSLAAGAITSSEAPALANLDATVSSRASQASVDTVDSNVDSILVDTGTTIPAQITALNNLSAADVKTQADQALIDYDGPTKAEQDAAFTEIKGPTWDSATDTLEAISDGSGGGGGSSDWTATEKEQIRDALGVDGTKTTAAGGQLQTVDTNVDTIVSSTTGLETKAQADARQATLVANQGVINTNVQKASKFIPTSTNL